MVPPRTTSLILGIVTLCLTASWLYLDGGALSLVAGQPQVNGQVMKELQDTIAVLNWEIDTCRTCYRELEDLRSQLDEKSKRLTEAEARLSTIVFDKQALVREIDALRQQRAPQLNKPDTQLNQLPVNNGGGQQIQLVTLPNNNNGNSDPYFVYFRHIVASLTHEPTKQQVSKIAYIKTHKTGSSTLGSVFLRYGARHGLRLYKQAKGAGGHTIEGIPEIRMFEQLAFDMCIQHTSEEGYWNYKMHDLVMFYNGIIRSPKLVTIVREPIEHYLSYYFYFIGAEDQYNLDTMQWYAAQGGLMNPLAGEFNVHTIEQLALFLSNDFPKFDFILVSDRMDESLLVMRKLFNWDLLDITYMRILDSGSTQGVRRYDGKKIRKTPKKESLTKAQYASVQSATLLDNEIYRMAVARLDAEISNYGPTFADDLRTFVAAQGALLSMCQSPTTEVAAFCEWYQMEDMKYEETIDVRNGWPLPVRLGGI